MEPAEYDELEKIARTRRTSVGDLMREAAHVQFLSATGTVRTSAAAQRFLRLPDISLPEWKELKREIEERREPRVP